MKATKKQIDYINRLYRNVYNEHQLEMLTVSTASALIKALLLYTKPRGRVDVYYLSHTYDWLLEAEKKAFGTCVSDKPIL